MAGGDWLKFCSCCGHQPISSTWAWCQHCLTKWGVSGLRYADWPISVRVAYQADNTAYKRRMALLDHEDEESCRMNIAMYGEVDHAEIFDIASSYGWDSSGGQIECGKCHTIYSDDKPTFPFDPHEWIIPTCPSCGSGLALSEA